MRILSDLDSEDDGDSEEEKKKKRKSRTSKTDTQSIIFVFFVKLFNYICLTGIFLSFRATSQNNKASESSTFV